MPRIKRRYTNFWLIDLISKNDKFILWS